MHMLFDGFIWGRDRCLVCWDEVHNSAEFVLFEQNPEACISALETEILKLKQSKIRVIEMVEIMAQMVNSAEDTFVIE